MKVEFYNDKTDQEAWEKLVADAHTGTFLHSRKFLDYHGTRYTDRSIVVRSGTGTLIAALPAANDPSDEQQVISHPGATFGGLLTNRREKFDDIKSVHTTIADFYKRNGFRSFIYKTVPGHFHKRLAAHDHYHLWLNNAELVRRDLWNVLSLNEYRTLSKGRKWSVKKAKKEGFDIASSRATDAVGEFHNMLTTRLTSMHNTQPVHTADEICDLMQRFPDHIELWLIRNNEGTLLAGTLVFHVRSGAPHTQYIATSQEGRDTFAGDHLIAYLIERAEQRGAKYFSFGASTENQGIDLNEGLFDYKSGFGVGSITHDSYRIKL